MTEPVYVFGGCRLDIKKRSLRAPDGSFVRLTKADFGFLSTLCDRPYQPIRRKVLAKMASGSCKEFKDKSVSVAILRLRRKLKSAGLPDDTIKAVRGWGYKFYLNVRRQETQAT